MSRKFLLVLALPRSTIAHRRHAMGPIVAGVIGSTVAAGALLALIG